MASKLELRFIAEGNRVDQPVGGDTYQFRDTRLGEFQVATTNRDGVLRPDDLANEFYKAFQQDSNYLGKYVVNIISETDEATSAVYGIVTIEHPDNAYFNDFVNNTTFIEHTITTTEQETEPTLNVNLAAGDCSTYGLTIETDHVDGYVVIESPSGNVVHEYTADGTPHNVNLTRRSTATTSVVRLYDTQIAYPGRYLKEVLYTAPPVLSITDVLVSGSPFGAMVTIETNSGLNREYSLDNVEWQGSKQFAGLLAGSYTAYVRDSYGCTKSKTFTVTAEDTEGLTADPFIRVPIHNSIRFAQRTGNNFLNYLSTENPGFVPINQYYQDYLIGDAVRTQFKSSYKNNNVYLIDENGNETNIAVIKKSDNINRVNIYEGNYTDRSGRLAVYFTSGNIYNADGTTKTEGHILEGNLPLWYEEGMYLNIENVGVTQIDRIEVDEATDTTYAITLKDSIGAGTGKITSVHTAHPYEVYEFETTFLNEGKYQIRLEYGNDTTSFYLSEILKIHSELPEEYLKVEWWNDNNNDILYNTGIRQFRRLAWENYFTLIPKAEKETYDTDTSVELINSKTFAVYELTFDAMPMEVIRGLQVAFDNSGYIVINGAVFVCENAVKLDPSGQWYYMTAELTLTDQTMNGQQEIVDVVGAEFLVIDPDSDSPGFLRL